MQGSAASWSEERLKLACQELSLAYWTKNNSGTSELKKVCDEAYSNVYPLIFHKTSEPVNICTVPKSQVEKWISSEEHEFAAVFAFVSQDHPLNYKTTSSWKLMLVGYVSQKVGNKVFTDETQYSSTMVSLMKIGITTESEHHYVFAANVLDKHIPIKEIGAAVTLSERQMDTPTSVRVLKKEEWKFKFHYYVASSEEELINSFPELMHITISTNEGSLNIISKRLHLYRVILKDMKVNLLDNKSIYNKLKCYESTLNCDSPSVQRYVITVFLVMSAFHSSFYKFFIYCESKLMDILCEMHKHEHHCSSEKCEIMEHIEIIKRIYETKMSLMKDFIEKNPEMKPLLALKLQLQRHIKDTFCDISQIEERYVQSAPTVLQSEYLVV